MTPLRATGWRLVLACSVSITATAASAASDGLVHPAADIGCQWGTPRAPVRRLEFEVCRFFLVWRAMLSPVVASALLRESGGLCHCEANMCATPKTKFCVLQKLKILVRSVASGFRKTLLWIARIICCTLLREFLNPRLIEILREWTGF